MNELLKESNNKIKTYYNPFNLMNYEEINNLVLIINDKYNLN